MTVWSREYMLLESGFTGLWRIYRIGMTLRIVGGDLTWMAVDEVYLVLRVRLTRLG